MSGQKGTQWPSVELCFWPSLSRSLPPSLSPLPSLPRRSLAPPLPPVNEVAPAAAASPQPPRRRRTRRGRRRLRLGPRQSPSLPDSLGSAIVHPIAPGCRMYAFHCPPIRAIPAPAHPQAVARRRPDRCARAHARTAPGRPAHDLRTRFGLSADLAVPGPSTVSRMQSRPDGFARPPLPHPTPPPKLVLCGAAHGIVKQRCALQTQFTTAYFSQSRQAARR